MNAPDRGAPAKALERLDHVRSAPWPAHHDRASREWFHFVVASPEVDVLVNLSVVIASGREGRVTGQLALLVRDRRMAAPSWDGDVDSSVGERVHLGTGRIRLDLDGAALRWDRGLLRVAARCRHRPIAIDLAFEPRAFPYLVHNMPLDEGGALHWLVAPRLAASGFIAWSSRRVELTEAPAYHDHNWGSFAGHDLAWDWGCSLPTAANPWSAVFVRLLDRARVRTRAQGLFLWRDEHRRRTFRGDEVSYVPEGLLRLGQTLRVPRALSLLAQGEATDVPLRLRMAASADGDRLEGAMECADLARVLVPRDTDLGTTVIHEIAGRLALAGRVAGEDISVNAPAFYELVGDA